MRKCFDGNRGRKIRYRVLAVGILLLLVYRVCLVSGKERLQNAFSETMKIMETEDMETEEIKKDSGQKTGEEVLLNLHAGGAVLMDGYTGRILYEKNASQVLPMASTTKIMTCITALENGDPDETVEVSAYAASMPDVQLGMNRGEKYRLGDLLLSLMLESHNDSAVAIAEHIGAKIAQSENSGKQGMEASLRTTEESRALVEAFAGLMNQKAGEIGCEDTYFITPNGLDASVEMQDENGKTVEKVHSTTAAELALIMRYCLSESEKADDFVEITQTREASFTDCGQTRSFSCVNHNRYLDMKEGAVSGKTGFTGKAGYCYVGAVNRDGVYLIVSLLACGWPPAKSLKWQDMNTLIDYGLDNYSCVRINVPRSGSGSYLIDDVPGRSVRMIKVQTEICSEPFSALLKEGESAAGSWYLEPVTAETGDTVGEYRVTIGDTVCRRFPVVIGSAQVWNKK